ncbi:M23 family metallopeptidase, partial [Hymenobacter segetis]
GAWTCTQGYLDGGPTHLGDWGQALDFAITDADGRTYHGSGLSLSDYYAYNKPVLAPADGVVEEVIQHIEDNAIGEVNTRQNWGNTVVLRHAPGLFTQLSHLRAHSVPVKVGDYVRRGDIIGTCGSSGRSPEPHLHFQVQATPYVGSRTLAYPLAYFVAMQGAGSTIATDALTPPLKKLKTQQFQVLGSSVSASDEPKTPLDKPNTILGSSDGILDSSNRALGSSVGVLDSSNGALGSSVSVLGSSNGVLGSSVGVLDSSNGALGSSKTPTDEPKTPQLRHFAVPVAGEVVSPPTFNRTLSQALRLPPGYALDVHDAAAPDAPAQRWEVFTDAYNLAYLRCQRTGAVLYFAGDESVFYCTAFYGDESSWLYLLYQAAYRVPLASLPGQVVHDEFPLTVVRNPVLTWVQDVLAPFYRFLRPTFWAEEVPTAAGHWPGGPVRLRSRVVVSGFGRAREVQTAELLFADGRLAELRVRRATGSLTLTCTVAGA